MTQRSRGTGSRPAWPPLDKQLADAKAPAGSQLEQLIRDNPDIALLNPAEASDDLGFPLWLRVYWRQRPAGPVLLIRRRHLVEAVEPARCHR